PGHPAVRGAGVLQRRRLGGRRGRPGGPAYPAAPAPDPRPAGPAPRTVPAPDLMSPRELVVLGTASQGPTPDRNHNGYLLRWDTEGLLFDPGEGTQRQLLLAGVAPSAITRICVTHFHGDHCLGLPGVLQRLSLDRVPHPVYAHYPASGQEYFA